MNQFIIRFISFFLVIGFYSQSYAMSPKPAGCPSAALIKAGGLAYTELDEDGYIAFQISNYGRV